MFTYVMKSRSDQEFQEEVEIRENQDFESDEEMTSEREETDDEESESNNANVNNYLDSAKMATNLESAMEIAEAKILATNFAVPAKIGTNDQLCSYSTPVIHTGAVLLAKNQVSLAKARNRIV